jgi:hypothetical protein
MGRNQLQWMLAIAVVGTWALPSALANPDPSPHRIQGSPFIADPVATAMLILGEAPSTVAVTRKAVRLDPQVLEEMVMHRACELSLDLPDMGPVIIDIHRHIHHRDGSIGAIGTVRGDAPSRVVLELGGGLLLGDIVRGHDMVQIRHAPEGAFAALGAQANGIHLVQSAKEQSGISCGNNYFDVVMPPQQHPEPPSTWGGHNDNRHDDDDRDRGNPFIDLMIVYTDGARAAIGNKGATRLLGHLTIDTANEIYADSDVDHRLRMARMYEVDYDETAFDYDSDGVFGTHNDHLATLRDDSDDVIDDIHTVRDQVGADLVTFLINDLDSGVNCTTCMTFGLGYRPISESTSNRDLGFHTCHWENMALPSWSMPHEAGHNLGAYHDDLQIPADNDGDGTPDWVAQYGRGHYWNNAAGNRERSIMGRNALGGTRVPYFSNPAIEFNGNDTGDATHDCSRMYDEVSDTISDYVTASSTTQYVDTNWSGSENGSSANPWDSFYEGYINVRWGGTLIMKNCEDDNMSGPIRAMLIKSTGGSSVFR